MVSYVISQSIASWVLLGFQLAGYMWPAAHPGKVPVDPIRHLAEDWERTSILATIIESMGKFTIVSQNSVD